MTLRAGTGPFRQASLHAPVTGLPSSATFKSATGLPNSLFAAELVMMAAGSSGRAGGAVPGCIPIRVVNAARIVVEDVDSRPMKTIATAPAAVARASMVSAAAGLPPPRPPRPPRATAAAESAMTAAAAPNRSGNASQRCGPPRPPRPPAPVAIGPPRNTATRPRNRAGSSVTVSFHRPAKTAGTFENSARPLIALATGSAGIQSVPPNNVSPAAMNRDAFLSYPNGPHGNSWYQEPLSPPGLSPRRANSRAM